MEHPIGELMNVTMEKIKEMVDVNTIVGTPITAADGTMIIPVSKVSYGFASGGSDLPTKNEKKDLFGGGSGAGVTIQPIAFLTVYQGNVKLISVTGGSEGLDKVLGMVPDVVEKVKGFFKKDKKVKEMLDLKHYNVGDINPVALPQDAARLGTLNIRGRKIDLLTYDGTYVDEETGEIKAFVPEKQICVTAPGAGRLLRGAVTQMEQTDGQWHTYMGARVPQYWADKNGRQLTVSSRPLLIPRTKNPFISATVLG